MSNTTTKKPAFPLLGKKTAVMMCLFWVNRHPVYYNCCLELLEMIKGAADITLIVTDDTVGPLPDWVDRIRIDGAKVHREYFTAGVDWLSKKGVGAFYWIGTDNIHRGSDVRRSLSFCMDEDGADVVFSHFERTDTRRVSFPVQEPEVPMYSFSVDGHSWTDSSCYRTSIFTKYPPDKNEPRKFILKSLKAASLDGVEPVGKFIRNAGFFHYIYGQRQNHDRSFLYNEE